MLHSPRLDRRAIPADTIERNPKLDRARSDGAYVSENILRVSTEIK